MTDRPTPDGLEAAQAQDPLRAAQQAMQAALPKRFYQAAEAVERDGTILIALDGRPARTPGRHPLALPSRALGDAVAAEWAAQGERVDPTLMPLTRIVNSAIDGVAPAPRAVVDDLVRYAGSDLLCYRAGEPARLVAEQAAAWDPILAWYREAFGAHFVLSEGVMFVAQPDAALATLRGEIAAVASPYQLAALHVMTTLTGSVLLAFAHARGRIGADEAWAAAHVDERYQESLWGEDEEALTRRARRSVEFMAASQVHRLACAA